MRNRTRRPAHARRLSFPCAVTAALALAVVPAAHSMPTPAMVASCPDARALPGERPAPALGKATVCLVNRIRVARGLRKLRINRQLNRFAAGHTRRMVNQRFFSHDVPGGPSFVQRARASAYARAARTMTMGENIAWGTSEMATPAAIVRAWMRSPGHRVNILRRDFVDIGIGVSLGAPAAGGVGGVPITYAHAFGRRVLR